MEEISTSFCFICLLHLANEQGLKLESDVKPVGNSDSQMDVDGEKKVGDIWDIKVCN
jgi:condensin complex subunit 2